METPNATLALSEANLLVSGGFVSQKISNAGFDVFLNVILNKLLNKHSIHLWFQGTMARMWRHCNVSLDHRISTGGFHIITGSFDYYMDGHQFLTSYKLEDSI